ncbi:50S ribosomal protein L6, partial [Gammaproteobacteria bacterium]|nr:50S ribosomal protein L6 [Gammaproteobacteria bacterium]
MSRVAKNPISIPEGVSLSINSNIVSVKGKLGEMSLELSDSISVELDESIANVKYDENSQQSTALGGTSRALINNMVIGVSVGFEKKLELKGVGYRAKASGKLLELTLGFSHPVKYQLPEEVSVETPSQTE